MLRSFLTLSHPKWKKKCPACYQPKRGVQFKNVSLGVVSFGLAAVAWGASGAFACSCSDGHSLRGQSRESWGKEGHMLGLAILPHKQVWRHAEAAALVRSLFVFKLFKKTCRATQNLKEMPSKRVLTSHVILYGTLLKWRGHDTRQSSVSRVSSCLPDNGFASLSNVWRYFKDGGGARGEGMRIIQLITEDCPCKQ